MFLHALAQEGLDAEPQCIIRREVNINGKSRAFINDSPVTLNLLNSLTSLLVDLQQQFGQLALNNDNFQIDVIDAIAQLFPLRSNYQRLYDEYCEIDKELNRYKLLQSKSQKEADYKQYLYDELLQADLKNEELERISIQLKQMSHAEKIIGVLNVGKLIMMDGEEPVVTQLKRVSQQLQTILELVPEVDELQKRILTAWADLKDVGAELESLKTKISIDEELHLHLQERIDDGYKLLKKHGVTTTNELLALQNELRNELRIQHESCRNNS